MLNIDNLKYHGSLTIWSMKFSNSIANEYELRNTYINDFIKNLIKKL